MPRSHAPGARRRGCPGTQTSHAPHSVLPLLTWEERESPGLARQFDARSEGESEEAGAREGAVVVDVGLDHDPLRARLREQEACDRVGDAGGEPRRGRATVAEEEVDADIAGLHLVTSPTGSFSGS